MGKKQYPPYLKTETKKIWISSIIAILLGILIIAFLAFVFVFNELIAEKFGIGIGTTQNSDSGLITSGTCISLWNLKLQSACYQGDKLKLVIDNRDNIDIEKFMITTETLSEEKTSFEKEGVKSVSIKTIELNQSDIKSLSIAPLIKSGNRILLCDGDVIMAGDKSSEKRIPSC